MPNVKQGDEGWGLVASRLDREIAQRGVTYRAIEAATGVSYATIQKLLAGEPVRRRDRLAALAKYFDWPGDAFDRIRRGEDPIEEQPVSVSSADGVDLEELRRLDPEGWEHVMATARMLRDRARGNR